MKYLFDGSMILIMIPVLLIIFLYDFPFKWKDRKFLFGVRNRDEFKTPEAEPKVEEIVRRCRKEGIILLVLIFVMMGLMFLIPNLMLRMVLWTVMVFVWLAMIYVPFVKGNSEMKSLKKELGIRSRGISYTDFTNAGCIHVLKVGKLIIPNVIALLLCLLALLFDLKVFSFGSVAADGSFALTIMSLSLFSVGLIMIPVGLLLDNLRTEVISENSTVNANYNRARKKLWADLSVFMVWINTAFILILFPVTLLYMSNLAIMIAVIVYTLALVAAIYVMVKKSLSLDRTYRKENSISPDDDDYWLLGSFYYNPDDTRVNVEKRAGVGGTINFGHPIGKVIGIVLLLVVIASLGSTVWVSVQGSSPLKLKVKDGNLVCSRLMDDYVIPVNEIKEAQLLTDFQDLKFSRISGYALDPVFVGNYSVEGESGCRIFVNTDSRKYIRFTYDGRTWYVSAATGEETEAVYFTLTED